MEGPGYEPGPSRYLEATASCIIASARARSSSDNGAGEGETSGRRRSTGIDVEAGEEGAAGPAGDASAEAGIERRIFSASGRRHAAGTMHGNRSPYFATSLRPRRRQRRRRRKQDSRANAGFLGVGELSSLQSPIVVAVLSAAALGHQPPSPADGAAQRDRSSCRASTGFGPQLRLLARL